jgi:uncharacterized protein (TIGR02246 family)
MTSTPDSTDLDAVRRAVLEIGKAWLTGHPEKLHDFFHADMVIVGPGYQELGRGREACVLSYEEFLRSATIHEYRESPPVVRVWGDTAVAHYDWEMAYEVNGQASREVGADLFVFARQDGRWLAVWRALQFAPKAG